VQIYDPLIQKAFTLLSRRRYTVLKLKEKLVLFYEKQVEKEEWPPVSKTDKEKEIKKVLTRLKELKYLNDTQFSKDYVENRTELRPRGKYLLKKELKRKGIHPDLAERVVEETDINEEEVAAKALHKKFKAPILPQTTKQKEKELRFLASRGFSIPAIYKAIEHWYNRHEI
jgi:regulatory protein